MPISTPYALYTLATDALSPLMPLYLAQRRRRGKEDAARLNERLGYARLERPEGTLFWVHAASVGEASAALPLIETVRAARPELRFLMTTGTLTSARLMEKRLPAGVIHQFVPVDTPGAVQRFLSHWQPSVGVWVESELWPNLVIQAHRQGCTLCLINARMSERSFRAWQWAPKLMRRMLRCFSLIAAQSEPDAQRFRALGGTAEMFGNLKYDTGLLPFNAAALTALTAQLEARPRWLAASTHPGEEETAAETHKALRAEFPGLLTLLVPRHPERGEEIADALAQQGWRVQLRSREPRVAAETEIYIADTLGELGLWYRVSRIAFVGGSLVAHGGQNLLEGARLSCALLHGPHMHNFAEIAQGLDAAQAALTVQDAAALADAVRSLLREPKEAIARGVRARIWAAGKTGVNMRIVEKLLPLIDEACRAHA